MAAQSLARADIEIGSACSRDRAPLVCNRGYICYLPRTDCLAATTDADDVMDSGAPVPPYTLRQLIAYILGLGTWGFGGPVVLRAVQNGGGGRPNMVALVG